VASFWPGQLAAAALRRLDKYRPAEVKIRFLAQAVMPRPLFDSPARPARLALLALRHAPLISSAPQLSLIKHKYF